MALIPEEKWLRAHHWIIWHGRRICSARAPACGECPIREACRDYLQRENVQDAL